MYVLAGGAVAVAMHAADRAVRGRRCGGDGGDAEGEEAMSEGNSTTRTEARMESKLTRAKLLQSLEEAEVAFHEADVDYARKQSEAAFAANRRNDLRARLSSAKAELEAAVKDA